MSGAATQPRELMVVDAERASSWMQPSPEERDALRATIGKDCNEAQFTVFMAAARHLGLDPLARQVVPIVQGGRMTVQTTIDGFRLLAQRSGLYGGQVGPFWCGPDGAWRDVWLDAKPPTAAKVGVIRRDFAEPMWGVARTAAYAKGGQWNTMPDVMIAKVAESLALRKAFPAELSGAYTAEELDQARREGDEEPFIAQARITEESAFDPQPVDRSDPSLETASAKQIASIRKLSLAVGLGEPREYPRYANQAKQRIAQLTEKYREQQEEKRTGRSAQPADRSTPGPATPEKPWNGLADAPFRKRLNALGYRTVEQVREFLVKARDAIPNKPEGSREQAFAYLESVERDAQRAANGGDADVTEEGFEPPADDAREPEPDEEIEYDLRQHPKLSGGYQP